MSEFDPTRAPRSDADHAQFAGQKTADAWSRAQTIIGGVGSPADLLQLIPQLDDAKRNDLASKFLDDIAAAHGGAALLDVADKLGDLVDVPTVLPLALGAKRKPNAARLQDYLALKKATDFGRLPAPIVEQLIGMFGKQPALEVAPRLG